MPDWSRRNLLLTGSAIGVAALAGGSSAGCSGPASVAPAEANDEIPPPSEAAAAPWLARTLRRRSPASRPSSCRTTASTRSTPRLTPIVDSATWQLRIHGMVDRETTLTWDELLAMPLFEQYVTIACVSNEIGGNLVGNAKWTGVRLRDARHRRRAGRRNPARRPLGRRLDRGHADGLVMDPAREPMIAVRMNDEPLPPRHGFPARLIVPGLYGYVSATKWLAELELTTLDAFDAYWVPLGWAKEAPILTQSRIDTPRPGSVAAGPVPIAGVAWAPDRGSRRSRSGSTAVAGGPPVVTDLGLDVGAVGLRLEQHARQPPHRGACHRRHGRGPDRPAHAACAGPGARGWHSMDVTVG